MVLPPRPERLRADKTLSLETHAVDREAPTLPPEEGMDEEAEVVTETGPQGAAKPWAPPQLDSDTRELISDTIARAIAAELGRVQISSIAPPSLPPSGPEPPRSSLRVAARSSLRAAATSTRVGGKWTTLVVGGLAMLGQIIVWVAKPEYSGPIGQAIKIIASLFGGPPGGDLAP